MKISQGIAGGIMRIPGLIRWNLPTLLLAVFLGCTFQEGDSSGEKGLRAAEDRGDVAEEQSTNRLAHETSPYLLLHADNPVDWYAWGPEAFAKAKQEDKPIFLSIGYSSCHWCHVMERKVFSKPKIARYMNEHFVNIKVDREERPDVDDVYMTSLMVYLQMTGSNQGGGWPLSMFLTPERKPFAGGTYFPPEDQNGRLGFPSVMKRVVDLWENQREAAESNAEALTQQVSRAMKPQFVLSTTKVERALVEEVLADLKGSFDKQYGGVDFNEESPDGPKFPVPAKLGLLEYQVSREESEEAAEVLYSTLDAMAAGGLYDHLGGGFHRYSTDRYWHVPHFEKMLYDQAQLADLYIDAYQATNKARYREVAEGTLSFVQREMTSAEGGFYSALNAETEGVEGKFYVWSVEEVEKILGEKDSTLFQEVYGVHEPKRFEPGYVLHLPQPLKEVAEERDIPLKKLKQRLRGLRHQLLMARQKRERPMLDDKILTSWNGLMIRAFAKAGMVLGRDEYIQTAEKAALFVLSNMRDSEGRLLRTYRKNRAKLNAYLDDYAFLVDGLLALHEATRDEKWLNAAQHLTEDQVEFFWDEEGKGFFFTPDYHEELLVRTKAPHDAVLPSGNSVSARNLIQLAKLTDEQSYLNRAEEVLKIFAPHFQKSPRSMTNMAVAMGEFLDVREKKGTEPNEEETAGSTRLQQSLRSQERDKEIVQVSGRASSETESSGKKKKKKELVEAEAYLSVDRLPAGSMCEILLLLKIEEGWHINTNPAKPDFLVPTEVKLKTEEGTELTRMHYPSGKKLKIPGLEEGVHVYEDQAGIRGVLKVPAEAAGKRETLQLEIHYQPCNDQKCLAPKTLDLSGKVRVAGPGERVKKINQKLFPPLKKEKER